MQTDFTQSYGMLNVIHVVTSSFVKTLFNKTVESGYLLMPPN